MRRTISLLMLAFASFFSFANDNLSIKGTKELEYHDHVTYEVWYDTDTMNPAYAVWDLTAKQAIISAQNKNRHGWAFDKCMSAPNATDTYLKSGFDRGHMCPNEDRDLSPEDARNTFRGCNVCPQTHTLNAGKWKGVENKERAFAKEYGLVTIAAGPIYMDGFATFLPKGGIRIPDAFFKVIIADGKLLKAYYFDQNNSGGEVDIEMIERLTGLKFLFGQAK